MNRYLHPLFMFICLFLSAAGLYAQTPVASYPFSGSAKDESSFANHGSVNGATLTQDRFGWANSAFNFDGVQAYLEVPNSAVLNSNFATVSFWAKATEIPAQNEVYLLSFGGWQERWKISLPNHGKLVWTTNASSGISDMDAGGGNELVAGVWKHLVFVHDGTQDLIYINGVQVAAKNVAGTLNSTTKPLGIGHNAVDGGNFFKGALDDVQIFDLALNAAAVAALYAAQNTAPGVSPQLVASYSFSNNGVDATAFGNTAATTDLSATTDRFGYGSSAYEFNGTSSEAEASNSAQLNSDFATVSFWVKPNSLPAPGTEVFLLSFGGWQERFKISLPSHAKAVWTTNASSGISDMDAGGGNELQVGVWSHFVAVHDGTNDKIFINGVLAASKAVAGTLNSTTRPLAIGFNGVDGGNWFDGALDEVQIFNFALNNAAVAALYTVQSTFPGTATDLVADYPFAGNTDDRSQFHNHLLASGVHSTTDRFAYASNASHFDGTASLVASNSVQLNSDYTSISFWVKPDELAPPGSEVYLLSNGGWQERWKISLPDHGKVVFTTNYENGISDLDAGGGNELTVGIWKHVVMVHDGLKDKIFINGVLANSKDVLGKLNDTGHPLGIGFNPVDVGNYFKGNLDDVQIYNRALSNAEVAALYTTQNTPPNIPDDLVANYTFDGDTDDKTPFHNNAEADGGQLGNDRFARANHAYAFNGLSDEITAANSPQLISDYATVSFWINIKTLPAPGSESYLLSFGGWQERWKISLPSHAKVVWTTNATSGISDLDAGGGNELPVGVWKHVVMVHDGTTDKIFIDGLLKNSKNVGGTLKSTTKPLGIGYNAVDGGNWFDGSLDEVQIYNRALSDVEIAALYIAQSTVPVPTDTEAPCAPLNLVANVEFTNVHFSWLPAMDNVGVVAYNVYQNGVLIATTSDLHEFISGLTPLTDYVFGVSAVDAAGNESLISTLKVTSGLDQAPDTEAPTVPGNIAGTAASNSVLITWDPSTDNVLVAGYVVLVDGVFFDSVSSATLSVFIGALDPTTLYTFEVYAYDPSGNNSATAELTLSTTLPVDTGEPGMVAHYPFDGDAKDATPYHNDGVIGGNPVFEVPTHPNGGGQNIKFDGVQDSVLVPNAVQLISDYATVSFWVRVDGDVPPGVGEFYVIDFGHWSERWKISLPQHLKIVWTTNSNNVQFPVFISDMDSGDGNEMVKTFWWYVTMVHDGTSDIVYVNGVQTNIKPTLGKLNTTARPLCFGSNPIEGGQYFIGALDNVKIYNKALTAGEIQQLFNTGTTDTKDLLPNGLKNLVLSVSPNPAVDVLTVKHAFNGNQSLLVRVFDAAGRQVDDLHFAKNEVPMEQFSLNVHNYPVGIYTLDFVLGGKNLGAVQFNKQ